MREDMKHKREKYFVSGRNSFILDHLIIFDFQFVLKRH